MPHSLRLAAMRGRLLTRGPIVNRLLMLCCKNY
jgi:hypothetical protein